MHYGAPIDTASEVLGKAKKLKRPLVTIDILDLSDKRRSFKKRKDDPRGYATLQSTGRSRPIQIPTGWLKFERGSLTPCFEVRGDTEGRG